jgi:hypothetical protein
MAAPDQAERLSPVVAGDMYESLCSDDGYAGKPEWNSCLPVSRRDQLHRQAPELPQRIVDLVLRLADQIDARHPCRQRR